MPKKKRRQTNNFYETLSGAIGGRAALPSADSFFSKVRDDLGALAHDGAHYGRLLGRKIVSKPARRLYIIAALALASVGAAVATVLTASTLTLYASEINNPTLLMNKKKTGTTILARGGEVIYRGYGAPKRTEVPLETLQKDLVEATLAAEDPDFYKHPGFSWRATARAVVQDVAQGGKVQGGSTITQQLVKNALLSSDKKFTRKFREILLATELERRYDKNKIMEMYLNQIYYGQGSYGIEAAAQTYFKKGAKDLTLGQTALLAGLPLAPSRFDPTLDPDAAQGRRDFILNRMSELDYITSEELKAAKAEPIQATPNKVEIKAPHFVFYILDILRDQYGDELVERGGITVQTSLDLAKQQAGEAIVREQVLRLAANRASNGGLVAVDPGTGEVLTMVGSIDYYQPTFGSVNVTLSQLQPGSSFKPFAYLTAFKKGWNGATQVQDKPLSLPSGDGTVYKPRNYDGTFRGPVLLRRALANSLNIPAVEVLRHAGIKETIQTAHDLGITSLNQPERYGLSLVLGGGEVRPLDMAQSYATLANGGTKVPLKPILKVEDRNGEDITKESQAKPEQVVDPRLVFMLTDILSDNNARIEEFGANSPLRLSRPAAAKTGTTDDFRDNWTAGYTPELAAVVWVGNNDHSPMSNVSGIAGAAPIWKEYMETALRGRPAQNFTAPDGLVRMAVCTANGGLLNSWDRGGVQEYFLKEALPTQRCSTTAPKPPEPPQPTEEAKPAPVGGGREDPLGETEEEGEPDRQRGRPNFR